MRRKLIGLGLGLGLGLGSCGGKVLGPKPVALSAAPAIDVKATAVIEQGDALYVLAGNVALIVRNGIVAARIEAPRAWTSGASIAAPDGDGRWVVALDEDGVPWRLTMSGEREAVADRLGLAGAHVAAIASAGTTFAVDLGDAIAYTTDGVHLAKVPAQAGSGLAVARGALARTVAAAPGQPAHVERWDLANGTRVSFPLAAHAIGFLDAETDHPRLVVTTDDRLWVETSGKLEPLQAPPLARALAVRGHRAWLTADGQLYMFDGKQLAPARADAKHLGLLAASATGDAWLATERGLVKFSPTAAGSSADESWHAMVAPVFQRVCAHCHLPGGEADFDLSTPASWVTEKDEIARRVLTTRTMPPAGTEISDADRATLEHWLGAK